MRDGADGLAALRRERHRARRWQIVGLVVRLAIVLGLCVWLWPRLVRRTTPETARATPPAGTVTLVEPGEERSGP